MTGKPRRACLAAAFWQKNLTVRVKATRVARRGMSRGPADPARRSPMAQKHQRSNREAKKPKQKKSKAVASPSPFPSSNSNPARSVTLKRK